jgi:hypothetical protein
MQAEVRRRVNWTIDLELSGCETGNCLILAGLLSKLNLLWAIAGFQPQAICCIHVTDHLGLACRGKQDTFDQQHALLGPRIWLGKIVWTSLIGVGGINRTGLGTNPLGMRGFPGGPAGSTSSGSA